MFLKIIALWNGKALETPLWQNPILKSWENSTAKTWIHRKRIQGMSVKKNPRNSRSTNSPKNPRFFANTQNLNGPGPFPEAIGRQKNPWFMWSKIKKLWPNLKAECQPWFMCYSECWWFHILTESPFFRGKSTTIRDMPKTQHTTNLDHQVAAYKMIFKGHIQLNRL